MKPLNDAMVDKVFMYLIEYKRTHDGCAPSTREIAEACSISTTSMVRYYLKLLVKDGRIRIAGSFKASRTIEVVGGSWSYDGPRAWAIYYPNGIARKVKP